MPRNDLIRLRGGPSMLWESVNPILDAREPGLETDTRKWKVGDGVTAWIDLDYFGGTTGGGGVESVNGEFGPAVLLTQDDIPDGVAAKQFTTADETKLAAIEAEATKNAADAFLLSRPNHTGQQPASTISDLLEAVQDIIGGAVVEGAGINVTYDDQTGLTTITATGVGNGDMLISIYDPNGVAADVFDADNMVDGTTKVMMMPAERAKLGGIQTGATVNAADAFLLARENHTGQQPASTISDFDTEVGNQVDVAANTADRHNHANKALLDAITAAFTAADEAKLDGIATGATANQPDVFLLARANHTGTQDASTITGLAAIALSGSASDITGGTLPTSVLPSIAITDVFTAGSQAAMLALPAEQGDVAVRSDTSESYILATNDPTVLADWILLPAIGSIISVNGQQGVVVLGKGDVGLAQVDNTSDADKPISAATQAALDLKFTTPTPLVAKVVFGTSLGGNVPGLVGYEQDPMGDTLAMRQFGGQISVAEPTDSAHAATKAYADTKQPSDSDLTAIAALATTPYGRALLTLADQAALMGLLSGSSETVQGIVELATQAETNTGTDDTRAVTPLKFQTRLAAYAQPLDSDLTAIAALSTTSYGRAFLALANQAALMALLASGTETASGILELATSAETIAGTDTVRATTPAGVKAVADLKANALRTINAQTGTTHTLALVDQRAVITRTNAAASTETVPLNATLALPVGFECEIVNLGAGSVTLTPENGTVVITSSGAGLVLAQTKGCTLIKIGTNAWYAVGALTA